MIPLIQPNPAVKHTLGGSRDHICLAMWVALATAPCGSMLVPSLQSCLVDSLNQSANLPITSPVFNHQTEGCLMIVVDW